MQLHLLFICPCPIHRPERVFGVFCCSVSTLIISISGHKRGQKAKRKASSIKSHSDLPTGISSASDKRQKFATLSLPFFPFLFASPKPRIIIFVISSSCLLLSETIQSPPLFSSILSASQIQRPVPGTRVGYTRTIPDLGHLSKATSFNQL